MKYIITKNPNQDFFGLESISIHECVELLRGIATLSLDVETTGLSPIDNRLLMVQISTQDADFVIDATTVSIQPLKPLFEDPEVEIMAHNAAFEYKFMKAQGITLSNVYDSMLASKLLSCGDHSIANSLKAVLERELKIKMDKEVRSSFIDFKGTEFTQEQIIYGVEDTIHLFDLKQKQMKKIKKEELEDVFKLECEAALALGDITYNGLALNKEKWGEFAVIAQEKLTEMLPQLDAELLKLSSSYATKQTALFEGRACEINWGSPKQVLEVFQTLHPDLDSVGAPVLKRLKNPIIKQYVAYKKQMKLANAYGLAYYKYLHKDNKIHPNFNQILNTGRVSQSSPNAQQLMGEYRTAFIPSRRGYVFVDADYSSMELVVLAHFAQEKSWLEIIRAGGDLHSSNAEKVFGDDWRKAGADARKVKRTMIKTIAFSLVYGAGAASLADNLEISVDEAQDTMDDFFDTFPRIKTILEKLREYGANNGYIRTAKPYSLKRSFPEWDGEDTERREMSSIKRQSANTFVQGTSAYICKKALILLRNEIIKNDHPMKIVNVIHDEILCEVKEEFAPQAELILQKAMEDAANTMLEHGLLKAIPNTSPHWSK